MLLRRAHLHVAAVDGATEARPQAQAEKLTLVVADNSTRATSAPCASLSPMRRGCVARGAVGRCTSIT